RQLCRELCGRSGLNVATYVLGTGTQDTDVLRPDQAIELRNRKESSLCLIVPGGLGHVTASSLGNSFASFDLGKFLHGMAERLEHSFPDELRLLLRRVRAQLK